MKTLRTRLTFANVTSCLALFVALGGFAVAAGLPKNSVGAKQLKNNAVTTAKIKQSAVTGAKINLSTLGTVPSATQAHIADTANHATAADTASALGPPEAFHLVGATGEPGFQNSWRNFPPAPSSPASVGFYKDQEGVVHLKGSADKGEGSTIFQLPPGYRPASDRTLGFAVICSGCGATTGGLVIEGSDGSVKAPPGAVRVGLDGITFRAES